GLFGAGQLDTWPPHIRCYNRAQNTHTEASSMAKQHTILIVDGNPKVCAELKRVLELDLAAAYTCAIAATPAPARAFLRPGLPEAILLGGALPDSDGLTLLAELVGAHGALAFAIIMLL